MRELAVQAMNGTYSDTQRSYLDKEYQALTEQIDRISTDTMWNDQKLLAGGGYLIDNNIKSSAAVSIGSVNYPAGTLAYYDSGTVPFGMTAIMLGPALDTIAAPPLTGYFVPVDKIHTKITVQAGKDENQTITVDIVPMNAVGFGIAGTDIGTFDTATGTLDKISNALETINNQRAGLGAAINQMAYAADNLTNVSSNATQSRSTIMDTDYALATTQLAKTQIIQQAATAMLAQANQMPQSVMALLKG